MFTKLNIPQDILEENNLTYAEFLYLLFRAAAEGHSNEIERELLDKHIGNPARDSNKLFLAHGEHVFLDSIITKIKQKEEMAKRQVELDLGLLPLAEKLQKLYPAGKRPGCSQQWRGSKLIIAKRLTSLRDVYGISFTEEEAIDAVKRYVESFDGDYQFMELLEHFILRVRPEFKTNFTAWLENKETEASNYSTRGDILTKLR